MSTATRNEPRPIPSDATLVWLASERAAPLFRTLDRTRAFGPLVILLATLPPMLATFGDSVTPVDAAWGLRALDATGAEMPGGLRGAVERSVPPGAVRPVALWLSAGLMRLVGQASPAACSLASLIGGALLLGVLWPLAKSLSGRRFAFWAVVLAAFHPTLTDLLRFPAPVTIGLAASAAAIWGSLNLDGRPWRQAISAAGTVVAIVISLAVVGPAALAVPTLIVIDGLFGLILPGRPPSQQQVRGAASVAAIAVRRVATAAGGVALWAAVAWGLPGLSSLSDFAGDGGDASEGEASAVGLLWGLAAIGLGRLLRVVHRRAAVKSGRPVPRTVLVWMAAGGGLLLWRGGVWSGHFDPPGRYVVAFTSLPVLLAAAYAIEEASRRTVSGAWVLLAVALPLAIRIGTFMATIRAEGPVTWLALGIASILVFWIVTRAVPAGLAMPGVRRGMLMGAVLVAIVVNSVEGAAVLLRGEPGLDSYRQVTSQLETAEQTRTTVLLADEPPLPLAFAVRATYPHAAMGVATSWDQAAAALARSAGEGDAAGIVVVWGTKERGGAFVEGLRPVGDPLSFADRELLIYRTEGE